jgi:hypothetical protein
MVMTMSEERCNLYDVVRAKIAAEHPDQKVVRPTSILWQVLDPWARYALMTDDMLAYVVTGPEITAKEIDLLVQHAGDIGLEHMVLYAHRGATLVADADAVARQEGVQVEFVDEEACPRPDQSPRA